MSTHNIHGEKINFHTGTREAKKYLKDTLSKQGFKDLSEKAESEGSANFTDLEEKKFKLEYDEDNGFNVYK